MKKHNVVGLGFIQRKINRQTSGDSFRTFRQYSGTKEPFNIPLCNQVKKGVVINRDEKAG
jgi:hypothetical protein